MSEFRVNGDGFGCYAHIKTDVPDRVHVYKVVNIINSNCYCDVPIRYDSEPYNHGGVVPVANVIHCGVDESKVIRVAVADCEKIEDKAAEKTEARDVVFRRCICEYGTQPQIDVALEELSELMKALLKWRRAKGAELTAARDNIIDEIADVRVMCRQMEILFQAEDEVERRIDFKVDRQIKRLDERKGGADA